jgi:nitrilase
VGRARAARMEFDPVGHYARPDVFRLVVDTRRQVTTEQDPAAGGSPADHTAAVRPRPDHGGASHAP